MKVSEAKARARHAKRGSALRIAVVWLTTIGAFAGGPIRDQSPPTTKGRLQFEVASVRQKKTDGKASVNVDPTPSDFFVPTGGLYSAKNIGLVSFISFAYKLTLRQLVSVNEQVPWVEKEGFDIEARAEGNPTKDEFRLMMRSLLEERFKLAVHYETREMPVFGLVLAHAGKLGPQLRVHRADDPACSTSLDAAVGAVDANGFPTFCGYTVQMKASAPGRLKIGGRNMTIAAIAASPLSVRAGLTRPMIDQSGLKGTYDFTLEWVLAPGNVPAGQEFHSDDSAATFEGALREQLGVGLVPQKGPAEYFVVDHVEHPSSN